MSITTKITETSILNLELSQDSSLDNIIQLPISKNTIIKSLEFAYESTGNIQYLNDIINLEQKYETKKVA